MDLQKEHLRSAHDDCRSDMLGKTETEFLLIPRDDTFEPLEKLPRFCDFFLYPKLLNDQPSIRLLLAVPEHERKGKALMEFSLTTSTLTSEETNFVALSYCWGSPYSSNEVFEEIAEPNFSVTEIEKRRRQRNRNWKSASFPIVCNGSLVRIGLNLFEALKMWYHRFPRENLWVDALCIDQSCTSEKDSQIKMMSRIYKTAERVLVWLGPAGYENDGATMLLKILNPIVERLHSGTLTIAERDKYTLESGLSSYFEGFVKICNVSIWVKFAELCSRAWFTRRWTLQEATLSKHSEVFCGEDVFNWDALVNLSQFLSTTDWSTFIRNHVVPRADSIRNISDIPRFSLLPYYITTSALNENNEWWRTLCTENHGDYNPATIIQQLFFRCRDLKVSNPRDVFFAIHSLWVTIIGKQSEELVDVDYSLQPDELFQRISEFCLMNSPSPDILSFVQDNDVEAFENHIPSKAIGEKDLPNDMLMSTLPSWVPRFAANLARPCITTLGFMRSKTAKPRFNVAMRKGFVPQRKINGNKLHLKGHYLGTLLFRATSPSLFDSDLLEILERMPLTVRGIPALEAVWRTLVVDSEEGKVADSSLGDVFKDWVFCETTYVPITRKLAKHFCKKWGRIKLKIDPDGALLQKFSLSDLWIDKDGIDIGDKWPDREARARQLESTTTLSKSRRQQIASMSMRASRFAHAATAGGSSLLFLTDTGDIGLGTRRQRPGDQVWIFENSRMPSLLRPRMRADGCEGSETFEFLEECFVLGIMDKELLQGGDIAYREICIT